jgi:hypothetical protein
MVPCLHPGLRNRCPPREHQQLEIADVHSLDDKVSRYHGTTSAPEHGVMGVWHVAQSAQRTAGVEGWIFVIQMIATLQRRGILDGVQVPLS